MTRAVFLDRDGTIIEDVGYPHERSQIRFLPGAGEAIRQLNEYGFKVIIVTNQAGVARGYFSEEAVKEINKYIQDSLAEQGAVIDMVYYCPHHIDGVIEEYRKACYCRKPNPGMIEEAVRDFDIDIGSSFLIGDHLSDVEAGVRAGCGTVLLVREESHTSGKEAEVVPDHIAPDLSEAVKWVVALASPEEETQ